MDEMLDTAGRLERVVDRLVQMGPALDLVLITGDLVDEGTRAEYESLRRILERLDVPLVVMGGNHDDPALLGDVLSGLAAPPLGLVDGGSGASAAGFTVDGLPLRIVVLDSTVADLHSGEFRSDRLAWLDAELARGADRPTLLAMHHPPIEVGMWWMDYNAPPGSSALGETIGRHPQVVGIAAGHIHRSTQCAWEGVLLHIAGSVAYQAEAALVAEPDPLVGDDEVELGLLRWDGRRLVAQQFSTDTDRRTLDVRDLIEPWEPYEQAARSGAPIRK